MLKRIVFDKELYKFYFRKKFKNFTEVNILIYYKIYVDYNKVNYNYILIEVELIIRMLYCIIILCVSLSSSILMNISFLITY